MSNMDSTEVEAASVEEATREALEQLGAREDEVDDRSVRDAARGRARTGRAAGAGASDAQEPRSGAGANRADVGGGSRHASGASAASAQRRRG